MNLRQPKPSAELSKTAILLDVDGTILDIAPSPDEVEVPDSLRETLASIAEGTGGALALISGRPLADLDRIFSPLVLPAIGGHGAEIRVAPDAKVMRRSERLDPEIVRSLRQFAESHPGVLVEDKSYSAAVHYRRAPERATQVGDAVRAAVENGRGSSLEVLPGKFVVEVKPPAFTKGTALRELMTMPPFAGRLPIFVGDDVTDDAAFAALPEFNGIGISVGRHVPGVTINLATPDDVRSWLERVAEHAKVHAP